MSLPETWLAYYDILCTSTNRDRWLEARRFGMSSSDAANLFGCGYGSKVETYAEKVLGPKPQDDDPKKIAGRVMESAIAELVRMERGGTEPAKPCQMLLRSKRWPLLTCTPDFIFQDPKLGAVILETKNTTQGEEWKGEKPCRRNWIQCQHQLAVTGQKVMLLAGLLWGYKLVVYVVERDDEWIERHHVPECEGFWLSVKARELPGPDASESCRKALDRLFPVGVPSKRVELDILDQPYAFALEEVDRLTAALDTEKNKIRAELVKREADEAVLPDGTRWTYTKNKKGDRTLRRWPAKEAATEPQEGSAA